MVAPVPLPETAPDAELGDLFFCEDLLFFLGGETACSRDVLEKEIETE